VPPDPEPRRPREGAAPPDPLPGRFLRASLLPIPSDAHPFEGEGKGVERKGRPWVVMAWGREAKLRQRTKAEPAACLPAAGLHKRERERGHGKEGRRRSRERRRTARAADEMWIRPSDFATCPSTL